MRDTARSWSQRQLPEGRAGIFTVCAGVLLVIAAALILLHAHDQHHHVNHHAPVAVSRPVVLAPSPATSTPVAPVTTTTPAASKHKKRSSTARKRVAAQDPQDRPGTTAAKRAARALASHRALQHVPYRHGDVTIRLTGALKNGKAILTVTAPTLHDAKAGYGRFLARYHDNGHAYRPRFVATRKAGRRA